MRIEFAVDATGITNRDEGLVDGGELVDLARAAEAAGIDRLFIADSAGSQDAATVASYMFHATATLGVQIEHLAGVSQPEIAARQLATLDQLSGGRVSVHVTPAGGDTLSHEESLARLDEYVMLLKRLWSNDKPIDHEGRFHRLKSAFTGAKPFAGMMPLVLAGASGTAIQVAARHADVFLLPAASVEETGRIVERVKTAAACHRRADAIRFALPVRPLANGDTGFTGLGFAKQRSLATTLVNGSPEKIALKLLSYCEIGITDFIVCGLRSTREISAFGSVVAPLVKRSLAHRGTNLGEEIQSRSASSSFARGNRYPA